MLDLEWWLAQKGIVTTELEEDPREGATKKSVSVRTSPTRRGGHYLDSDDDNNSDS